MLILSERGGCHLGWHRQHQGAHSLGVERKTRRQVGRSIDSVFSGWRSCGVCDPCKGVTQTTSGRRVPHTFIHLLSPARPVQTHTPPQTSSRQPHLYITTDHHLGLVSFGHRLVHLLYHPRGVSSFLCLSKCPSTIPWRTSVFGRAR